MNKNTQLKLMKAVTLLISIREDLGEELRNIPNPQSHRTVKYINVQEEIAYIDQMIAMAYLV